MLTRFSSRWSSNSWNSLIRWLLILITATVAVRGWHHFRTSLVPGMDAAYYLIQARALLTTGRPRFADLPLVSWIQAGLAWLLAHGGGMAVNQAIVLAVKLEDTLLPPLVAIPMGLLGWRWARAAGPSLQAALLPATIACLSAPMMRMVGDFQKNALALVWLALLIWSMHGLIRKPGLRSAALPIFSLILCGLTHIGVFGAALVFTGLIMVCSIPSLPRKDLGQLLAFCLLGLALVATVTLILIQTSNTAKFTALAGPIRALASRLGGGSAGGRQRPIAILPAIPALVLAIITAKVIWKRRAVLPVQDRVLALVSALSPVLFVIFDQNYAPGRLLLIAVIPATVALSFLLANLEQPRWHARLGNGLLALAILSGLVAPVQGPVIDEAESTELQSLAEYISPDKRTLVVAEHGLEYWVGWILDTNSIQPIGIQNKLWEPYSQVLYLERKEDVEPFGPDSGPPPRGPRRRRPPGPRRPDEPERPKLPSNAPLLHDGPAFKLWRYPIPVASLWGRTRREELG